MYIQRVTSLVLEERGGGKREDTRKTDTKEITHKTKDGEKSESPEEKKEKKGQPFKYR